ncbi:MAG: fumarate hydratase [Spirochaetales bacterium]|nr:fumarate hydratase [Spirochaetales bacterium]
MSFKVDDKAFTESILELIRITSTDLSHDAVKSIERACENEDADTPARTVFEQILENISLAKNKSTPICQDTGTCIFYVTIPVGVSMRQIQSIIASAVKEATIKAYLRPNAVHSVTGNNSGDNIGDGSPQIHFDEWDQNAVKISLMLKGGGCENVSTQYNLPDTTLKAGRNLDGVYKCVVDSVNNAQGLGCAPGLIGVGIGGDRAAGALLAKKQIFRDIEDKNEYRELADLENTLYTDLNTLGIGPMGFGGKTTVLGVKINQAHRLPASFFVSIAYMCWAARRRSMVISENGVKYA